MDSSGSVSPKGHQTAKRMIADALGVDQQTVRDHYVELMEMRDFLSTVIGDKVLDEPKFIQEHAIIGYIVTRVTEPSVVVETGVYHGFSTAFILKAMEMNGTGKLASIDLVGTAGLPVIDTSHPDIPKIVYDLPRTSDVGHVVPDELTERWELQLGRSDETLEPMLDDLGGVDVFMHDSEHSYETISYELRTVFPHLRSPGVLIVDDVTWNTAFAEFTAEHELPEHVNTDYLGPDETLPDIAHAIGMTVLE